MSKHKKIQNKINKQKNKTHIYIQKQNYNKKMKKFKKNLHVLCSSVLLNVNFPGGTYKRD